MKYLLVFVVVIVGLTLLKKSHQHREIPGARKPPKPAPPEHMYACSHCGVHAPQSRCVWKGDNPYCCSEHARLG